MNSESVKKKIIFDTNVISYISKQNLENELLDICQKANIEILLPLAILLELSKTADETDRKKFLLFISNKSFIKLHTETYYEALEIKNVVEQFYPKYIINEFANSSISQYLENLQEKYLTNCFKKNNELHNIAISMQLPEQSVQLQIQRKNKENTSQYGINIEKDNLLDIKLPFFEGDVLEPWKQDNICFFYNLYLTQYKEEGKGYRFFLDNMVDMTSLFSDKEKVQYFWKNNASPDKLPRNWTRCMVRFLQQYKKIIASNPFDEMIASNLINVDFFYTTDKKYYDILEIIKRNIPKEIFFPTLKLLKPENIIFEIQNSLKT